MNITKLIRTRIILGISNISVFQMVTASMKLNDACSLEKKAMANLKVKVKLISRVWLLATPRTLAYKTPPSMELSRQEKWSGLPFPSPGDLSDPGIKPVFPALQADTFITWATREVTTNLDSILKSRDITLPTKGPSSQSYGFSNSHVWMWELDHKESWTLKNRCFYLFIYLFW